MRTERGFALVESLAALALVGTIVIGYLSGLASSERAAAIVDEQSTAESMARTQMEWVKKAAYSPSATTYSPAAISSFSDYTGYSVNITAAALNTPDDGIQKITVAIRHVGRNILTLEGYKVNR